MIVENQCMLTIKNRFVNCSLSDFPTLQTMDENVKEIYG